ncbi:MAG: DNA sulfur modification protein DndB [Actinomycetota bacterium]
MTELQLSGYESSKQLVAQRYHRDGKSVFVIALPIHLVPTHLPMPNPDEPFEGNRTVNVSHAVKFGEYWRDNRLWAAPPLLMDTMYPLSQSFEKQFGAGGVEFGIISLPHNSKDELQILDGQHRIFGWADALRKVQGDLTEVREQLQLAKRNEDQTAVNLWSAKLAKLADELERSRSEYVTLEVWEGMTREEHKQAFHDIAVNAKGITKSVTMRFDTRQMLNRIAQTLTESHDLLTDRVELDTDTTRGSNPNWLSGKAVVDIVRSAVLGVEGRMTKARENSFKETPIQQIADKFFDLLLETFTPLRELSDETVSAQELRTASLLGSSTIIRVLAGAFHLVAVNNEDMDKPFVTTAGFDKMKSLFKALDVEMGLPINDGWFATGVFADKESKAPSSRSQDLRKLSATIAHWAEAGLWAVPPASD